MKKWILNNWPIKLVALLIAFITWFVIIGVTDPVSTKGFDIPIEFLNEDYITKRGQVVDIIGDKSVYITVEASRSVLNTLSEEDFSATADFSQMYRDTQVPITVKSLNKKVSLSNIEQQQASVEVSIENLETVSCMVEYEITGEPGSGYILGNVNVSPETVSVRCPESVVPYVKRALVTLSAEGITDKHTGMAKLSILDGNGDEIDVDGNDKISWTNDGMVSYTIDVLKIKKLDINVNIEGTDQMPEGYVITGINVSDTEISVSGNKDILANISKIDVPVKTLGLTESKNIIVDIEKYLPQGVELYKSGKNINVDIQIDHYEEQDIAVDADIIEYTGLANGLSAAVTMPQGIPVKVGGLTGDLAEIKEEEFTVTADLTGLIAGVHQVPLQVTLNNAKCKVIDTQIIVEVTVAAE